MSAAPVLLDGEVVEAGGAFQRAVEGGGGPAGALDTLRVVEGARLFEARHLARLRATCAALGLSWPEHPSPREAWSRCVQLAGAREMLLRTVVARDPASGAVRVLVTTREVERPAPPGARFALAAHPGPGAYPAHKTTLRDGLSRARASARERGAFDALLCREDGELVCATIANLWLVRGGRVATPALERGCLAGVTRAVLLDAARAAGIAVEERALHRPELDSADELWTSNSGAGLVPAVAVEGRARALPGAAGPWFERFRALLGCCEAADRAASPPLFRS